MAEKKTKTKLTEADLPTLKIKTEQEIAEDFASKVYQRFDKIIKSIILFGSTIKHTNIAGSDIDIVIIIDDATVNFDDKMIMWYREELGKIIQTNPYKQDLHINTVKLTTWWEDLTKGDPTVINILRYGEAIIDYGGFFDPLKTLLAQGRIKPTPEAIYTIVNRIPDHILRSKLAQASAIEGCYWAMIESAQALLMSIKILPPSPEHVAPLIRENFVDKGLLKMQSVTDLKNIYDLHRKIIHGEVKYIDGKTIEEWQKKSEDFFKITIRLINDIIQN